jgi:hypothetical protein
VTSDQIGMKNFLEITTEFKVRQLPVSRRAQGNACLRDIRQMLTEPHALGAAGVFVATARKV